MERPNINIIPKWLWLFFSLLSSQCISQSIELQIEYDVYSSNDTIEIKIVNSTNRSWDYKLGVEAKLEDEWFEMISSAEDPSFPAAFIELLSKNCTIVKFIGAKKLFKAKGEFFKTDQFRFYLRISKLGHRDFEKKYVSNIFNLNE